MKECDLPQVCACEQLASPHPWKESHFVDSLKSGYTCIIAERGGEIIGYAIMMIVMDEAHLLIITIDKDHQRQGYGHQLIEHLTSIAINKKCITLLLEVRETNESAFQLYLNNGFCEIGQRPRYYADTGEDAIVMALDLQPY